METLHGGEGGDVERWLEPRNKSFVFAIDFHFASDRVLPARKNKILDLRIKGVRGSQY